MAGIIDVNSSKNGLARSLPLRMEEQSGNENSKCELERPINKIVTLGSDEVRFSTQKNTCC